MKKEEEEKCARKEEGMNSDSPQDNRKIRKNAQQRLDRALLREKVKSIKTKAQEEFDEEEARLIKNVDERRIRRNARRRERALEMKTFIEMVMSTPEEDRTEEEQKLIAAKKRRKEGARQGTKTWRERGGGGRGCDGDGGGGGGGGGELGLDPAGGATLPPSPMAQWMIVV
jgi:hypothetical protein